MSFRWADLLEVAESLASCEDEASIRTCASRAYYAVFGEAREAGEREGGVFAIGSVHEAVASHFSSSTDRGRMIFAANLKRLKADRVRADYRKDPPVDRRFAEMTVADARQLLQDLQAITGPVT